MYPGHLPRTHVHPHTHAAPHGACPQVSTGQTLPGPLSVLSCRLPPHPTWPLLSTSATCPGPNRPQGSAGHPEAEAGGLVVTAPRGQPSSVADSQRPVSHTKQPGLLPQLPPPPPVSSPPCFTPRAPWRRQLWWRLRDPGVCHGKPWGAEPLGSQGQAPHIREFSPNPRPLMDKDTASDRAETPSSLSPACGPATDGALIPVRDCPSNLGDSRSLDLA